MNAQNGDSPQPSARGSVLIVDDNRDAADALAMALREFGHTVAAAYSARQALDMMDENPEIRIVVSDIRMPDVSGFDFRRVVRHRFPGAGLVNAVVPLEKLEQETVGWCREMLQLSPFALRLLKASFIPAFAHSGAA